MHSYRKHLACVAVVVAASLLGGSMASLAEKIPFRHVVVDSKAPPEMQTKTAGDLNGDGLTDNTKTKRVIVNGVEAKDVDYNFHQWEVRLSGVKPGKLRITAFAKDEAGNIEQTPHKLTVVVTRR